MDYDRSRNANKIEYYNGHNLATSVILDVEANGNNKGKNDLWIWE